MFCGRTSIYIGYVGLGFFWVFGCFVVFWCLDRRIREDRRFFEVLFFFLRFSRFLECFLF